jgi:hypothetical protein
VKEIFYNAWYPSAGEWCIYDLNGQMTQDKRNPAPLSLKAATELVNFLTIKFKGNLTYEVKRIPFIKIIPGIPLDSSLPILQAGYIQDRARKRYRQDKVL